MSQNETTRHMISPAKGSRMRVSLRHGITCFFDVGELTIKVWGSAWTGREIIEIEDSAGQRVVSDKRSLRFQTPHDFDHDGHQYRVTFRVNLGLVEIRLYRDGELIDSDLHDGRGVTLDPVTGLMDWPTTLKRILPALLLGLAAGAGFGFLVGSLFK